MKREYMEEDWIKEHAGKLLNFIRKRVENEEDARDIFQETLISAYTSLPLFKNQSSFFSWLCGIARHEIGDFYRKKKIKTILFSHLPWLEDLASEALGPEQTLLRKEVEEEIKKAMAKLSEGYREILRLKYYQGLTVAEIAKELNETVKAVESKLFRARQAFIKVFALDSS